MGTRWTLPRPVGIGADQVYGEDFSACWAADGVSGNDFVALRGIRTRLSPVRRWWGTRRSGSYLRWRLLPVDRSLPGVACPRVLGECGHQDDDGLVVESPCGESPVAEQTVWPSRCGPVRSGPRRTNVNGQAGGMFWLCRNKFVGSQVRLRSRIR